MAGTEQTNGQTNDVMHNAAFYGRAANTHTVWYSMVQYGLTSHSTHYRSFQRQFYRSVDPTNRVIALKDDG